MRVSVVGLGKLGSPLAAVLADKGLPVVGIDLYEPYVTQINDGRAPVQEPGLQECIDRSRDRLRATTSYDDAILNSDISFVIVPTPSQPNGFFTNKFVLAAMEGIGAALRKKSDYHVVVVTSTVMPGSTGGEIREALERHSGRRVGDSLGLCYSPEFIALGSVVKNLLYPDFALIGESDRRAGDMLESVYRRMCEKEVSVSRMNFVCAEITKIAVNTFVTTKITYANMVAELCDRLPEADVDVVTGAIGLDQRIGSKYLSAALGYGGPCFPRDNKAYAALARSLGASADIAEATDRINNRQVGRVVDVVRRHVPANGTVAVLGLSYKPNTNVVDESQGVMIAQALAELGYRVLAHDPLAGANATVALGAAATILDSAQACVDAADIVAITTPWPEFCALSFPTRSDGRIPVIDCWRLLDRERIAPTVELVHLGAGASSSGMHEEAGLQDA